MSFMYSGTVFCDGDISVLLDDRRVHFILFCVETVANARDGEDKTWVGGIWLDLAAQLANVYVQVVRLRTITCTPDLPRERYRALVSLAIIPLGLIILIRAAMFGLQAWTLMFLALALVGLGMIRLNSHGQGVLA